MIKKLLIFAIAGFVLFSCSDDETEKTDITVSGLEDISVKSGSDETLALNISFNNETPATIALTLENVPEGIECTLSKTSGTESFISNLTVSVSDEAEAGDYEVVLKGAVSDGTVITKSFKIEVIKVLSVSFKVYNADTWTEEDPTFEALAGVTVTVFNSDEEVVATATTDDEGVASIYNLDEDAELYFTAETSTMSNIVQQEEIDGKMYGFVVTGVYETQEEIDASPQPSANIGDLKLADLNGDFIINNNDKTHWKWFHYKVAEGPLAVTVYLSDKNP